MAGDCRKFLKDKKTMFDILSTLRSKNLSVFIRSNKRLEQPGTVKEMTDTNETQLATARKEMLEMIALHTYMASDKIGKETLAKRVMEVMGSVPRHEFVPAPVRSFAYLNQPLPIGHGKTISQPFIVALMTDLLDVQPQDHILEIGTGLGYQAAILGKLAHTVYSVEIISELAQEAEQRLQRQHYGNIVLKVGDGSSGWSEQAPFDKIIVTAAPELIPVTLLRQLKPGGRMVIPAGIENAQQLLLVKKDEHGSTTTQEILAVRFSALVKPH